MPAAEDENGRQKMEKKIYRLTPALKDNLWGGERLKEYGKSAEGIIAESWELSFTEGGEATVDGVPMSRAFGRESWGTNCDKFPFFPTLTKLIDAREKLSVQVHPADDYALKNEGMYGKTEMWYIVGAEEGAGIYMGLKEKTSPEVFAEAVENGTVENLLAFHKVSPGQVYFIPAGTVHAICDGVLIFEIQQNSTLTYRLYDYMRRDKEGNLRPLHVEKAMGVSNLSPYGCDFSPKENGVIGECEYFRTEIMTLKGEQRNITVTDESFLSLTVIEGTANIGGEVASRGDSFFCPAGAGEITVFGNATVIAVSVPKS